MKLIKRHNPSKYYSESVIHNNTIYLSGMIADDYNSDITTQCKETFQTIDLALSKAGTGKSRLLSLQCWISDFSYFEEFNEAYYKWVNHEYLPVRATAQCA